MTPKEKSIQLVDKFESYCEGVMEYQKECALIAVDEIIAEFHMHDYSDYMEHRFQYFIQVKHEIENL